MSLLVRIASHPSTADEALALRRIGLPSAAREYLREKLGRVLLLVTGAGKVELSFLRRSSEDESGRYPMFIAGDAGSRPGAGLLRARQSELEALATEAGRTPELARLAGALSQALEALDPPGRLVLGKHVLPLGTKTYVMGVVNVTPDSFSDGGRFLDADAAIAHGRALAAAGADVLDIGGESTRPGAPPVDEEVELRRVLPVVEALASSVGVPLSVDTRKARVADEALARGAVLVNDVSGLKASPDLAERVAARGGSLCLMHMRGTPETMQERPEYSDVIDDVLRELGQAVEAARGAGLPRERLLVDPGIGFGKTLEHNLFLLRRIHELRALGCPVLVGTSRKSFLGSLTGGKPPKDRLWASVGSAAALAAAGVDMVRVHDVAEVRDALAVVDAVRSARGGGPLYGIDGGA